MKLKIILLKFNEILSLMQQNISKRVVDALMKIYVTSLKTVSYEMFDLIEEREHF